MCASAREFTGSRPSAATVARHGLAAVVRPSGTVAAASEGGAWAGSRSYSPARDRSRSAWARRWRSDRPPRPRCSPRRTPCSASRSSALAWTGPADGARPDGERPAGAASRPRSRTCAPCRSGSDAGSTRRARVRRRPLDGPVHRDRRCRRHLLADGVRLVRERGPADAGVGSRARGAMAAMIGLDDARLPELEAAGAAAGVFTIANRNSPGQVVVSGERRPSRPPCRREGARRASRRPAAVSASPPIRRSWPRPPAACARVLADVPFRDPTPPLIANADARPLVDRRACRAELVEHLTAGVDWVAGRRAMSAAGVDDVRRGRARPRPDRTDQADRARRPGLALDEADVPAASRPRTWRRRARPCPDRRPVHEPDRTARLAAPTAHAAPPRRGSHHAST